MSCVLVDNTAIQREPVAMRAIQNPFWVTFSDSQRREASLTQGIECSVCIRSETILSTWFIHLWGVEVNPFYASLRRDWDSLRREIMDGTFLDKHVLMRSDPQMITDINKLQKIPIKAPKEISADMLGPVPRGRFPLVLVLIANDESADEDRAVAYFSVVHLKDSICTGESSLVAQFLKQANGRVTNIQQLYTTGDSQAADGGGSCVICLCEKATLALLPCRHTCLCEECLPSIDFCPMCRITFTSHFRIKEV